MATQRQLEANRANAKRSTGPRTGEGKRASRRNALRHGLSARLTEDPNQNRQVEAALLLKGMMRPNPQDLSRLSDEELDQLEQLFRKAAGLEGEPSITDAVHDQVPASEQQDKATTLSRKVEMLSIFLRHETSLMNDLIKTLRLLRTLQAECAAADAEANTIDEQPGKRNRRALQ